MKQKSGIAKNIDMIHGPIFQSLILFALPLLGSNIFQQFYNTMDTMIVGNYLGDVSLAAIGVCTPCLLYTYPSPRDVEEDRMPSSA